MKEVRSSHQWREILDLAEAAVKIPKSDRLAFFESAQLSPDMVQEARKLTGEFEQAVEPDSRINTKIDHFLILEHLGHGGMGDVYSARDLELDRLVALKFLNLESMGVEGAGERFIREARTASALNHPSIVTIHGVIRSGPTAAIVMELIEGVSLRARCGTPSSEQEIVRIAYQVADALAAAHAAGVVHRDLKPENVMVRSDGRVKVLDFGLARWFAAPDNRANSVSIPGVLTGTLRYMSPEQCRGEPLTGASDIFSFGLVLYELASGRHPFEADSAFEMMQRIAGADAEPPSKWNPALPRHLDSLILAMLDKDPAMRPTAETIAATFAELDSSRNIRTSSIPIPLFGRRKRKIRMAWTIGFLAAVAIVLFWRLYPSRNQEPPFDQITTLIPENRATAAALSPDSAFTAYANVDGLFLRTNQSGETNALHAPKHFIAYQLSWVADGTKLIASGLSDLGDEPSIWSISITGVPPRKLRDEARNGMPSPDGTRVAFINADHSSIWTMGASGEEPRQVVTRNEIDAYSFVFWSTDGRRLMFQRRRYSPKQDLGFVLLDRYYARSLDSVEVETGKVLNLVRDFWFDSAVSLPDDRALFLRMEKPGSNISNELWELRTDSATGALRAPPHKRAWPKLMPDDRLSGMSASADGKKVVILRGTSQNAVFVADFDASTPRFSNARRLTLDGRSNYPHSWTADGSAVIFESDRNGSWDLFKQRLDQRTPESIIATPHRWEVMPQLAPDGKWVLYAAGSSAERGRPFSLMRVPVEGGTPQQIPTNGPLDEFRCSFRGHCIVRTAVDGQYYAFHELDPVRGIGRELARTAWQPAVVGDWTMSPDGSQVALPNHDPQSARLRVVYLNAGPKQPKERELDLKPLTDLLGLAWASDGNGWFVSAETVVGKRMMYVYPDGRSRSLGNIEGWAVPSPDGRLVAYLNRIEAANAWMVDLR